MLMCKATWHACHKATDNQAFTKERDHERILKLGGLLCFKSKLMDQCDLQKNGYLQYKGSRVNESTVRLSSVINLS